MNDLDDFLMPSSTTRCNVVGRRPCSRRAGRWLVVLPQARCRSSSRACAATCCARILTGLATMVLVLRRHAGLDASCASSTWSRPEQEQGPQGDRHRALADPQPDAVRLRRRAWPRGPPRKPGDVRPTDDSMTWQFYGGTIDPDKRTRENIVFFFGMEPEQAADHDGRPRRADRRGPSASCRQARQGDGGRTRARSSSAASGSRR